MDAPTRRQVVRVALTRHGQTEWNATGRLQGSSDIPLNDVGRGQAVESAARFGRGEWDAVATSPLSRAAETGRIIADALQLPVHGSYPDLVERDYGDAEGATESDVSSRWPNRDYPGLEPREAVAERGLRGLDTIAADLPGATVIVVAHGTIIREILRTLTEVPIPAIVNAATSVIEKTDDGWRVLTVNDLELSAH